ncbi:MAG: DUF5615 family PIN-like protein [Patescibacteria group bacterium]
MVKKLYKYKILLDENMPPRSDFPRLNEYFDVKHIDHDLGKGGVSDQEVYLIAVSQKRIILTHNIKHFLTLSGTKNDVGIIGIPPSWQSSQIDMKLISLLRKNTPKMLTGKYINLGQELK